jgi:hypothetical protein
MRRVRSLPAPESKRRLAYSEDRRSPSAPPSTISGGNDEIARKRRKIWQAPPLALHGPDNHPFFLMFMEKPEDSPSSQRSSHTRIDSKTEQEEEGNMTPVRAYQHPMVYPFLPPPTLGLEDETVSPVAPAEQPSTEESPQYLLEQRRSLTVSEYVQTSTGAPPPIPSSSQSDPLATPTLQLQPEEQPPTSVINARCTLEYVRAVPSDLAQGYALIHGQIWRSGTQRRGGWRRNQWVIDGG